MSPTGDAGSGRNILVRLWTALWRPSARYSFGVLVIGGGVAGILFWGGFNWAMELSNTESFCISCHEMRDTVYKELKETVHFSNKSGVRAICADCHVPREWIYKVVRKIQATNELYHKIVGTVNTPEKFEAQRLVMAQRVWTAMKATDSRECRNCHSDVAMNLATQGRQARRQHAKAKEEGKTCIDCHQGIAHKLPHGWQAGAAQ